MIYVGIVFLLMGVSTLFFHKDPMKFLYLDKNCCPNDENTFLRFQSINYILAGVLAISYLALSNLMLVNKLVLDISFIIICTVGAIIYYKKRKRYLKNIE